MKEVSEGSIGAGEKNGDKCWTDIIEIEINAVKASFRVLEDGEAVPNGYQFVRCCIMFDIKIEDFQRRAWLVAGGHMMEIPPTITYESVASHETVSIVLTIASFKDLQMKAAEILNSYVTTICLEKIWTILSSEFDQDAGTTALIVIDVNGLTIAGAAFINHLEECMKILFYNPCLADHDL